ncbi:S24 family peptidase [Variovorax sp. J22G73]|uniref:LexA family protein n=1 Tax=unclassified Variovorax TaxID=663243 RepID=UPI002578FF89|nr:MULTISPECIES: S24 family peptidase [unclassified Variovorax]MDM0007176.1 S24 family peptidase [Variovorax sp. J22R203]MDM0099072.1 S24 family peptidase [Variovorax sp. J22G73]
MLDSFCHIRDYATHTNVTQDRAPITNVNTIGERIKYSRQQRGLTQQQLAVAAGVSTSTIGNLESGLRDKPRELNAIARALRASSTWLETGRGIWDNDVNVESGPDIRGLVPLISWVRAGNWDDANDPFLPGEAETWLGCPTPHSSSTYVLRVKGDSMTAPHGNTRTYPEGCLIFVDPEKRSPMNGDRIVAKLEGENEVTFKVYKNEDGRQWLQPLNPAHEPIRQPFRALGTVIGKWEDG